MKQEYVLTLKEQVDVHVRRAAVLRALPAYLHEDDSRFLKLWDVSLFFLSKSYIVSVALMQEENSLNFNEVKNMNK